MSSERLEAWEQASLLHGEATRYKLPQDVLLLLGGDLGQLEQIIRGCRAAESLRRLTRVAALLSWVLAQEAYGYFYAGRLDEAISVARRAQEVGRKAPFVGAVTAAALE